MVKGIKGFQKGHPVYGGVNTRFTSEKTLGEKNVNWKGDKVDYFCLHKWISYHLGPAKKCEFCGSEKNVEWANKSGEYKREFSDFIQLCKKCHCEFDNVKMKIIRDTKTGRFLPKARGGKE